MYSGLIKSVCGVVMIVIPEPSTTSVGAILLADGIRDLANYTEKNL